MTPDRQPTMQQIADEAGVSRMAVSLALRNSPKISAETAKRIHAIAVRLGYRPNPLVSALMTQLRHSKDVKKPSTLAYVTAYPTADGWKRLGPFLEFHDGALARADALGYTLEEWWLRRPGMTTQRFCDILYTRNIHGVLIAPLPPGGEDVQLDWPKFATSTIGYSLTGAAVHRASNDQYDTITLALRELTRLGYRRIGLAIPHESDVRVKRNWSAGMLVYQQEIPENERVPMLLARGPFSKEFASWFQRHRPQAVLSLAAQSLQVMNDLGCRVPRDAGFAHLALSAADGDCAGVNQNSGLVGAGAVDLIDAQLRRNERGIPQFPKTMLVQGQWVPGPTVRDLRGAHATHATHAHRAK